MAQITLDKTDLKILQVLQSNGRLTNVELSERVALSPSPCLRRLCSRRRKSNSAFKRLSAYPSTNRANCATASPKPCKSGRKF